VTRAATGGQALMAWKDSGEGGREKNIGEKKKDLKKKVPKGLSAGN